MHPFFKWIGFPIRKSADHFIFADPRGLSQLITSFIASESQGIPRVPFLTFFYTLRLLPAMVCLWLVIKSLGHWVIGIATNDLMTNDTMTSLLLSSLSIYFFQYVKERFVSLQLLTAHCKLPAANWLGGE